SSPLRKSSVLLHNVRGQRFEVTDLVNSPTSGFSAAFLDVNHDGRLDIFQAGFGDAKSAVEQVVFGEHTNDFRSGHSTLFLQTADGKFEAHEEYFDMSMSTMARPSAMSTTMGATTSTWARAIRSRGSCFPI